MKTILLLRHGKSDWSKPGLADFDRPLAGRGKKDAPHMGKVLLKFKVSPDIIISSPAKRARMTAEIVAETCGFKPQIKIIDALYNGDSHDIISILKNLPDWVERPMLVGHNPTFEETISTLLTIHSGPTKESVKVRFPTAALVCINADITYWNQLTQGCCTLLWLIIPRLLKAII